MYFRCMLHFNVHLELELHSDERRAGGGGEDMFPDIEDAFIGP